MNDLISVVIPTYNRKDKLPACIQSVLAQTYANLEVIVVDDASTDGTQHLFDAPGDPRVHYVRYEQNRGACYARNLGAQRAHGSILAFQDSDDLWHAEKLQKQYALPIIKKTANGLSERKRATHSNPRACILSRKIICSSVALCETRIKKIRSFRT